MKALSMLTLVAVSIAITPLAAFPADQARTEVKIGSKTFTESVILGEMTSLLVRNAGAHPIQRRELGGTRVLWNALLRGEIDIYPEYTGTISQEIFAGQGIQGDAPLRQALAKQGIMMTRSLGFSDNYAIGLRKETCQKLGITKISDLRKHPEIRIGFSNEFMDRTDGWPGLRKHYGLPQKHVYGMDHDLAYRGLEAGSIEATDLYSTDAEIKYYDLCVLKDDLHYFPVYAAVILYRKDLTQRAPKVVDELSKLEGQITESAMIEMNARAKLNKIPESTISADFLAKRLSIGGRTRIDSAVERLWRHTLEHLYLVGISLIAAIVLSIPLGIVAAKRAKIGQIILGIAGLIQTVPSLALLVFMIPLLGIGGPPALAALFLYSLLPIIRNTYVGLRDIPSDIRESAEALGLPPGARLRLVELPMASRTILAGIKTSAVINVGTATLGALIGAGGYGQPILTGIRLDDIGLIMQGAIPAAILALLVQGVFELAERLIVPKGLRLPQNA
ncbi:MAG: ABC transporter permease subunit [Candidatus Marsarchaeota archaeon]|nr:ABC transporter permease subunit [Candidatus Marsarchaeota archaeon]